MRFRQMACSNFFYYSLAVEIKLEAAIAHPLYHYGVRIENLLSAMPVQPNNSNTCL